VRDAGRALVRRKNPPPGFRMATTRIIKKYPNRRLYDTEISSYITLEDVRQLIVDGEEFEVRDAKSGDDLTRTVLLQIIAEHEERGQPMFSTQLLTQIIRFYGDSLQGFMGSYLERSMQLFLEQQSQFRSQLAHRAQSRHVEDVPAGTAELGSDRPGRQAQDAAQERRALSPRHPAFPAALLRRVT
jgi:polyhydroxyalkanoate synthesis repressor PhaR